MLRRSRFIRAVVGAATGALLVAQLASGTVAAGSHRGSPTVGHVYVNQNTAGRNTIAGFDRHRDGSLSPIKGSPFDAGGAGTGAPYGSSGGLQEAAGGRFLLATDPASNQVSVLRVLGDGRLRLVSVHGSGGLSPVSIAVHGRLVYVANAGPGGSDYTGFVLDPSGHLHPIPGSTYALPDDAAPGQVLISPDGRRLIGVRVGPNAGPSFIDAFRIGWNGRLVAAPGSPFPAQRIGPFGSVFSPRDPDLLFVSNAHDGPGAASVSVYDVARSGALSPIAGSPFADGQTAACWVAISPDGRTLFVVNTAVPSISRFSVARNGGLTLVGSTPFQGPAGAIPFDAAVTRDGRYLYVVDAGTARISAFAIRGHVADRAGWLAHGHPGRRPLRDRRGLSTDPWPPGGPPAPGGAGGPSVPIALAG